MENIKEAIKFIETHSYTDKGIINGQSYEGSVIPTKLAVKCVNETFENATFKKSLKDFCISLRKKQSKLEQERHFCSERKFELEKILLQKQIEYLADIIREYERFFDLGFVCDNSLG